MTDRYRELLDELLDGPNGLDRMCWLRRRTNAHYEHSNGGRELEGSSDVSCYMYNLWRQRGEDTLDDYFGFWINGEICDIIGVPRTYVTEQFHNKERS